MSKTALGLTSWVTSGKSFPCFLISKTGPHHISIVGLPRRVSARWGGRSRTAQHYHGDVTGVGADMTPRPS